jgi:hypothetical protein
MTTSLNELLAAEIGEHYGVVIRYIPKVSIRVCEAHHYRNKPNQEVYFDKYYNREMMKETEPNSYGGKWLAMTSVGSGSTTMWSDYAMGDTPEEALEKLNKGELHKKRR